MQLLKASSVHMYETVDNQSSDLGDQDVTLRKKNSIGYLISTISGQKLPGVSEKTLRQRRAEFGMTISDPSGPRKMYTKISSNDLNTVVKENLDILPDAGETYVIGALRQQNIHVQRHQIRGAIEEVDPVGHSLRRTISIVRRVYSVPAPNSL